MNMIDISHLDVVFGDQQTEALALLDQGLTRQEVIDQSGAVVGVQNANLQVREGEICVLMGLSGSGKSSLLRTVNGLNRISRGSLKLRDGEQQIEMANCDARTLRQLRTHRISMVFQKFALMPWLSVLDNVAFGLEMKGMNKKDRHRQAMEKLEMVSLDQWAHHRPHELSGGMQQRVGLARAFAMDSDILLMDEPFSALDPLIRAQLQDELIELQRNLNKTILFVSHDLDEALKIGSHIAIMESAKIIQHGKPEEIVLNPENSYVEDFVAHTNPLNVLGGKTLMTPAEKLEKQGDRLLLNSERYWVELEQGRIARCGRADSIIQSARNNSGAQGTSRGQFSIASSNISMREAIQLRYDSRLPVLLEDEGQFVGVLNDANFYYGLLGKHFVAD
ncbi:choline ABC transporter ATP-binding protein [Aestuariirhabdus litorea]|uniref:Choline ABC transporter ATP-binding protein n=1 Tax=Aestuariirhabdus litorea TaxID=2528527 RepID=A0A3P3VIS7_9GAMM|nr:choline ABC transporter ATP-binding protein [Aestuariirhabdus litorea]RRJ82635.1 choline ABC transporter ATP-binding protein [Aestuariirhabdus litorea]RWW92795.1 choline ABC transporter ATP-binding protein [Endozoicomonadaceae bacterium GTF-13]